MPAGYIEQIAKWKKLMEERETGVKPSTPPRTPPPSLPPPTPPTPDLGGGQETALRPPLGPSLIPEEPEPPEPSKWSIVKPEDVERPVGWSVKVSKPSPPTLKLLPTKDVVGPPVPPSLRKPYTPIPPTPEAEKILSLRKQTEGIQEQFKALEVEGEKLEGQVSTVKRKWASNLVPSIKKEVPGEVTFQGTEAQLQEYREDIAGITGSVESFNVKVRDLNTAKEDIDVSRVALNKELEVRYPSYSNIQGNVISSDLIATGEAPAFEEYKEDIKVRVDKAQKVALEVIEEYKVDEDSYDLAWALEEGVSVEILEAANFDVEAIEAAEEAVINRQRSAEIFNRLEPYVKRVDIPPPPAARGRGGSETIPQVLPGLGTTYEEVYDIGKAQKDLAVTPEELEFLGYNKDDIEEALVQHNLGKWYSWKRWIPGYELQQTWRFKDPGEKIRDLLLVGGETALIALPMVGWAGKAGAASARTLAGVSRLNRAKIALKSVGVATYSIPKGMLWDVPKGLVTHPVQTLKGFVDVTLEPIVHTKATVNTLKGIVKGQIQLGNYVEAGTIVAAEQIPGVFGTGGGKTVPLRDISGRIMKMPKVSASQQAHEAFYDSLVAKGEIPLKSYPNPWKSSIDPITGNVKFETVVEPMRYTDWLKIQPMPKALEVSKLSPKAKNLVKAEEQIRKIMEPEWQAGKLKGTEVGVEFRKHLYGYDPKSWSGYRQMISEKPAIVKELAATDIVVNQEPGGAIIVTRASDVGINIGVNIGAPTPVIHKAIPLETPQTINYPAYISPSMLASIYSIRAGMFKAYGENILPERVEGYLGGYFANIATKRPESLGPLMNTRATEKILEDMERGVIILHIPEFVVDKYGSIIPAENLDLRGRAELLVNEIKALVSSEGYQAALSEYGMIPVTNVYPYAVAMAVMEDEATWELEPAARAVYLGQISNNPLYQSLDLLQGMESLNIANEGTLAAISPYALEKPTVEGPVSELEVMDIFGEEAGGFVDLGIGTVGIIPEPVAPTATGVEVATTTPSIKAIAGAPLDLDQILPIEVEFTEQGEIGEISPEQIDFLEDIYTPKPEIPSEEPEMLETPDTKTVLEMTPVTEDIEGQVVPSLDLSTISEPYMELDILPEFGLDIEPFADILPETTPELTEDVISEPFEDIITEPFEDIIQKPVEDIISKPFVSDPIPSPSFPFILNLRSSTDTIQVTKKDLEDAVTFRQGLVWITVLPPYEERDVYTSDAPPPGVYRVEEGTPKETLSGLTTGGAPPKVEFVIPWGIFNIRYTNGVLEYESGKEKISTPDTPRVMSMFEGMTSEEIAESLRGTPPSFMEFVTQQLPSDQRLRVKEIISEKGYVVYSPVTKALEEKSSSTFKAEGGIKGVI